MNKNKINGAYKYRAINLDLIDSLVKRQIYFSPLAQLNDPFDCRVNVMESYSRALGCSGKDERLRLEAIRRPLENFLVRYHEISLGFGIYSYSTTSLDPVMWSHYAAEHRGVCLAYEFPVSFQFDNRDITKPTVIEISPVNYTVNPLTAWIKSDALNVLNTNGVEGFELRLMSKLLTIKGEGWRYEKEARMISHPAGFADIDPKSLKQVCFGLNASGKEIDLVGALIDKCYRGVNKCKTVKSESMDFGLEVIDI